jgi:hypothetical protein
MVDLVTAMGSVLLTAALLAGAFVGFGAGMLRLVGVREWSGRFVLLAFWLGFAAAIAWTQIWHFMRPINLACALLFITAGLSLLALHVNELAGWLRRLPRRPLTLVAFAAVCLWIANRAIGAGDAHDSGLYHYPMILWNNSFAVVPGLGNLSACFALNNSSLLYAAMLDNGPWDGRANHLANALLLMALVAHPIRAGAWVLRGRFTKADVLETLLIVPAVMLVLAEDVSSPKTDLPVGVMMLAAGAMLFRLVCDRPGDPRERSALTLGVAVLSSAAVCIKLSAGFFGVTAWLIAVAVLLLARQPELPRFDRVRTAAVAVLFSTVLIGPWLVRGIMLSGYPLFPSTAIATNVDWTMPEESVEEFRLVIANHMKGETPIFLASKVEQIGILSWYAWLMKPPFEDRMEIKGLEWLRPWFFTLPASGPIEFVLPVLLAIGAGVWWHRCRRRAPPATTGGSALTPWFFAPIAAGLIAWLLTAPGPRYVWPLTWLLAGGTIALALSCHVRHRPIRPVWILLAALVLCLPSFVYHAARVKLIHHLNPLAEIPFVGSGSDRGFHPMPTVELTTRTTAWGLEVYGPAEEEPLLLWDAPLPADAWPPLDPNLRLRRAGDLAGGFRIEEPPPTREEAGPPAPSDEVPDATDHDP